MTIVKGFVLDIKVTQFIAALESSHVLIGPSHINLFSFLAVLSLTSYFLLTMDSTDEDEPQFTIRPLRLNDLPFCIALEEASFPPNEAATLEKARPFTTRITNCRSLTEYKKVQKQH